MDVHHSHRISLLHAPLLYNVHRSTATCMECILMHVSPVACHGSGMWHRGLIRLAGVTYSGLSLLDVHCKCFELVAGVRNGTACCRGEKMCKRPFLFMLHACLTSSMVNIQEASAMSSFTMANISQSQKPAVT